MSKSEHKVLSFERDAEFHFEKFQRHANKGNYLDSLVSLRLALQKDAHNAEYLLSLSELLTEIEYFEESNFVLFELMREDTSFEDDALFGMGCNFLGLHDYEKARECFEKYLSAYPDGEMLYEAMDMLDMLDEADDDITDEEGLSEESLLLAEKGRHLLDIGDYDGAISLMETLLIENPSATFIKNNLALAYYCQGNLEKCYSLSHEILDTQPYNLHALCNICICLSAISEAEQASYYIKQLDSLKPQDIEESLKLLLTYCELSDHKKVYRCIKEILQEKPYDARLLFIAGVSCTNIQKYQEALSYFLTILKIEPENSIALYYKNLVQSAKEKNLTLPPIQYIYQVPLEEIKSRFAYINQVAMEGEPLLTQRWKEDQYFQVILLWALSFNDLSIKRIALELLFHFADDLAIHHLKRYLLRESEPDDLKNDIFVFFNAFQVDQPYLSYVGGKIAEVRVGIVHNNKALSKSHHEVLKVLLSSKYIAKNKDLLTICVDLLNQYISAFEKVPSMRNHKAWAAAFLFLSLNQSAFEPVTIQDILDEFSITESAFSRCLRLIKKTLQLS